jgi:hypothetical protein
MIDIEFKYLQNIIVITSNLNDNFSTVFSNFYERVEIEPNSVMFLFDNKKILENKKIIDFIGETEKLNNKITISVIPLNINNNHKIFEVSKEIICPKCSRQCRIKMKDYLIELYDCKNNHTTIMKIDEFYQSQKIDLKDIKCNICKIKNLGNIYMNEFYYCQKCNINICHLCKENHDNSHIIINYEQKNYICPNHHESFNKYCHNCKMNICKKCYQTHSLHNLESFDDIISEPDNKKIELEIFRNEINIFNNNIKKIINGLNQLIANMETYYQIFNDIFNTYDIKNKNFQVLDNMKQIDTNSDIYKEISEINKCNYSKEKIDKIMNVYCKMKVINNIDPFNFSQNNTNVNNNYEESKLI